MKNNSCGLLFKIFFIRISSLNETCWSVNDLQMPLRVSQCSAHNLVCVTGKLGLF